MKQEKIVKNNVETLEKIKENLKIDFDEARELRLEQSFSGSDKEYFMTRCKQAEGIISAVKNALENVKELEKNEK